MQICVRLFGGFRRYTAIGGRTSLALAEGVDVQGLLERLGIPEGEVGLVSVNGRLAPTDAVLHDGDDVDVFSPIGGGR